MAGFCGAILFLTLIVTLFLSYRQSKDDSMASQAIEDIRQRGQELETRFNSEFDITLEEAIHRLQQFGYAMTGFIAFLTKQVPPDWW
jgi:CHASE3 domain sensor protein